MFNKFTGDYRELGLPTSGSKSYDTHERPWRRFALSECFHSNFYSIRSVYFTPSKTTNIKMEPRDEKDRNNTHSPLHKLKKPDRSASPTQGNGYEATGY